MKIIQNFDLTDYNSYRLKSVCSKAFLPENEEDIEALSLIDRSNLVVIGGGYNIILSKDYYDEEFVIFSENFSKIKFDNNRVYAEAGATLYDLSVQAQQRGLSGLEIFYDIPSSLGGAVVMNAGASGEEIKDILVEVRYFDPVEKQFHTIERKDISFEYRNSFFQKNPEYIIVNAILQLTPGDPDAILEKMEATKAARWAKQPKELPNAGSVFKRPPGRFVGPMIEQLGLKGFSIGGAKISEKHAGFIVNYNNATGQDILNIIKLVKDKVYNEFGVDLEIEQRII